MALAGEYPTTGTAMLVETCGGAVFAATAMVSVGSLGFRAAASSADEMAARHTEGIDRDIAVGSTFRLNPKPGLAASGSAGALRKSSMVSGSDSSVCGGAGNSAGETLTSTYLGHRRRNHLVTLTDGPWLDDDPGPPFCSTRWVEVLRHLKKIR